MPADRLDEAKAVLAEYEALVAANPLMTFQPHSAGQRAFLESQTRIVAAFAGNRWGKSSALIVKTLCQLLPERDVPPHLLTFKQVAAPCHGWIANPTDDKSHDTIIPALRKWCPPAALKGGSWAKAFNGERMQLSFACGSTLALKTYRQDASTLGGADLDFVGYDEPPPQGHRNECLARMARGVREWYAMTPLRVNVAWIRREIWRKREDPDITVVRGAIHENPTLAPAEVAFILGQYSDVERKARETGEFMDLSGLVYARFADPESGVVLDEPPPREFVAKLERIVGIDPGIRNAAIVYGGFDAHGVDYIFDEDLIHDGTPSEYIERIDAAMKRWGLQRETCLFVIDPAARQRSQATGDTVQSELARLGLHTVSGVRDREVGQQQIRDRLKHGRLKVSPACLGLRDEADEFAYPIMDDGSEQDAGPADDSPYHRLATLRYQVMMRPFYPEAEERAPDRNLGWRPGQRVPAAERLQPRAPVGPMGSLQ